MASDGETKDVSSQVTDAMETSTGSVLGKRGNEDICKDDEEEEEDSEDENWDKDSFDGKVYDPKDDSEYSDEDFQRKARAYNRMVIESKGFFGPNETEPIYLWRGIATVKDHPDKVIKDGKTVSEFFGEMATKCVQKYNRKKDKNVQFVEYLRANFSSGSRSKFYITFKAKESESPDAPDVVYQAKAIWSAGKTYPILCRPAPPRKGDAAIT